MSEAGQVATCVAGGGIPADTHLNRWRWPRNVQVADVDGLATDKSRPHRQAASDRLVDSQDDQVACVMLTQYCSGQLAGRASCLADFGSKSVSDQTGPGWDLAFLATSWNVEISLVRPHVCIQISSQTIDLRSNI